MSVVMIKCPTTDRAIFTGIEIDFVSFNRLPDILLHSYCPICGLDHPWRTGEAWLASYGADSLPTPVAGEWLEPARTGVRSD